MKRKNQTTMVNKIKCISAFIFIFMILAAGASAAEEEVTVLDTLVVTESGSKEQLLYTTSAITVLTEKDIKNSGQTKTSELISAIPGVVNQKAGSVTYFSLRGTRGTLSAGAVIYVDGRPINTGLYGYSKIDTIPLDNIEKIEVIKSPPASKYGANSARGIILITTKTGKSARKEFGGYVSGEYGSWNSGKATAGITGVKNDFDYSLNAYAMESDGYRHTNDSTKAVDGQIGYLFDGGRLDFVAGYNDSYTTNAAGLPHDQLQQDRRSPGYMASAGHYVLPSESDADMVNAGIRMDYDKNNWFFNSALTYTRDNQLFTQMKDFNHANINSKRDDYQDDRIDTQYDIKITGGRVFDLGTEGCFNTLTLGLDHKHAEYEQERAYPFNTLPLSSGMITGKSKADMEGTKKHLGVSLNNDLNLDRFRLQTGLRLNKVEYDLINQEPRRVNVKYDSDMDFSISPSYAVFEKANLFVTYNRSNFYMPLGHYKLDMQYDQPEAQAKDLKPERYDTWETGFKHRFHPAFNYSVILYYTQVEDKVGSFYVGNSFKGYRNAGTSIHKGLEVEVDGRPLSWLGYRLGFTTIDAEWDEGSARGWATPTAGTTTTIDLAGKKVHYVPEFEYSAGLDFYPFQNTPYGSLTISVDVRGFGEQYQDYSNNLKMEAATFFDLKLAWDLGRFEWYLACTNLFDKKWDKYGNAPGRDPSLLTGGTTGIYPQDGRYIGAGMSFRF
jgi:outer membrane receptor protein involved in Fe transport